jgi:hypothetical protein
VGNEHNDLSLAARVLFALLYLGLGMLVLDHLVLLREHFVPRVFFMRTDSYELFGYLF